MKILRLIAIFLMFVPHYTWCKELSSVVAKEVLFSPVMGEIKLSGKVQSRRDILLSVNQEGDLLQVSEPGQRVSEGDLLVKVDDTLLKIQIEEQRILAERGKVQLNYLSSESDRMMKLQAGNLISKVQVDEILSRKNMSGNDLMIIKNRIEYLTEQLKKTEIRAPFDGMVAEKYSHTGEFVRQGEKILRIIDTYMLEVVASVPARYISVDMKKVFPKVYVNNIEVKSAMRSFVPAVDEMSQTFSVYIDLTNPGLNILDGQFAEILIPFSGEDHFLPKVPRDALVLEGDNIYIYIVRENNEIKKVKVRPGEGSREMIAIQGDVFPGDRVVIEGASGLEEGQFVAVTTG